MIQDPQNISCSFLQGEELVCTCSAMDYIKNTTLALKKKKKNGVKIYLDEKTNNIYIFFKYLN